MRFAVAAVYIRIFETKVELARLSHNLIQVCNLHMQLLCESVGVIAITFGDALFAVLRVQFLLLLHEYMLLYVFSICKWVSHFLIPAIPVWSLSTVVVVAVPSLSSYLLETNAPPGANLI